MSTRGKGRGRGRASLLPSSDQLCLNQVEKLPQKLHSSSPYPSLEFFPAVLSSNDNDEELLEIKDKLIKRFQSSSYFLKQDKNISHVMVNSESTPIKKLPLNFNWEDFPLELRPTNKRKLKDSKENLELSNNNQMSNEDLSSWFIKLEEKERKTLEASETKEFQKSNLEELQEQDEDEDKEDEGQEEEEEFDDEELDDGTDYGMNYFNNGEGYLDDDDDLDEGPCY